jgi:putative tricarboxylic transport membrane protein
MSMVMLAKRLLAFRKDESTRALITLRNTCGAMLAFVCAMTSSFAWSAEAWRPTKPVEFIVGVASGAALDTSARTAQRIFQERKRIPQPINVVNRPGSGSAIAWNYLNTHAGDGHHLSLTTNSLVTNAITGANPLTYTDVTPIVQLSREFIVFIVTADSPMKNGRDLLERLKKDPASVSFGLATSLGNPNHIAIAQVARAAGADVRKLRVVVFNASPQAMTAVMGSHIDVMVSSLSTPMANIEAGKLRTLAASAPARLPGPYASAPTWKELGVNSISQFWRGVIGPRGMTPTQVAYWESEFAWLAATDEWKSYLARDLLVGDYQNARDSAKFLQNEYAEYKAVLTELGLVK